MDIHFHGAVGHDFCDADEAGLQAIADFEASKGVLAICPATMTFSEEILNGIMDVAAAHKNGQGADLVGINMEGPYISPKKIGAQNPKYVQGADAAMFRRLQARSGGLIKLVDVAPEEPGNLVLSVTATMRCASRLPTPARIMIPPRLRLPPVPAT